MPVPQATFLDSAFHSCSPASWRERRPTIVGLAIVVSLVIHNLVFALIAPPDPLASFGVRVYRLHGGGYWVDPQSLGRLVRTMIIWPGINWILTIALVLIVIFWEKRAPGSH